MRKFIFSLLAISSLFIACTKNEVNDDPGKKDDPVDPVIVEYLDLLVTAPSSMQDGWKKDDIINVSTGGYKLYPYKAQSAGKTVCFTSADENSGIVKNKENTYSLQVSIGEELEIPTTQIIVNGKNTTEVPSTASCVSKAPNADGLLELEFIDASGTTISFEFAPENVTLNAIDVTALGGESLIGTSEGFSIIFQGGLDLSSGATIPVYVTPTTELVLSKGLSAVANPGETGQMARAFLVGKTLSFQQTASGNMDAKITLDKWILGGIASSDDLFAYSYFSGKGMPLTRFESEAQTDSDLKTQPSVQVNLLADIDMTGIEWTPIPSFKGIFDGNGHTIDNLTYSIEGEGQPITYGTKVAQSFAGFINELGSDSADDASVLKNVTFGEGCNFSLSCNSETAKMGVIGGIVGRAGYGCVLKNITNKASIVMVNNELSGKYSYMGGLVGVFNGSKITSCNAEGPVGAIIPGSGAWHQEVGISTMCGVAVEQAEVEISDCHVRATAETYAHVRTYANFVFENKYYVVGNVGRSGVGGVVGIFGESKSAAPATSKIINCSNEAQIAAGWWKEKYDYPLVDRREESIEIDYNKNLFVNIGGIVGLIGHKTNGGGATVDACTNSGKILLSGYARDNNTHSQAGGIVGAAISNGSILTNLNNSGDIVIHGQQVGALGGCVGLVCPGGTNGDSDYYSRAVSSVRNLTNSGNIYISGTKTYFKHGNTPHIVLGGVIGVAVGQVSEVGTPSDPIKLIELVNNGKVSNKCKDMSNEESYCLGGVLGFGANVVFEGCENYAKVASEHAHVHTMGCFTGTICANIKNGANADAKDYYSSVYFKDCKCVGTLESADMSKGDYGCWIGWCSRIGSYFNSSENTGNKIGGAFGTSESLTQITSDNFSSVVLRSNVTPADGQIRLIQGKYSADQELGEENDNLWNSFSFESAN